MGATWYGCQYSGTINNDTWYHLAFTYDTSAADGKRIKIYLNGVEDNTSNESATINAPGSVTLGKELGGMIDEVRVSTYNSGNGTVRSVAWIKATYHSGNDGLVSWGSEEVSTNIKSVNGIAKANIKSVNGIAIADVKSVNGIA